MVRTQKKYLSKVQIHYISHDCFWFDKYLNLKDKRCDPKHRPLKRERSLFSYVRFGCILSE